MKPKLYIDCQFFQTPVWDRGMGKYSQALIERAADKLADYDVTILFNAGLPQDPAMLKAVKLLLPGAETSFLDLWTTERLDYRSAASHNKEVLETMIRESNNGVQEATFFLPCLFQEPTASVYPDNAARIMIYYDAIPFLYYQKYKNAINYDNYLQRYATMLESDVILTISETVKDDLAIYLGIEDIRRRVVSIDGAAVEADTAKTRKPLRDIPEDYILLTTSDDVRKNNRAAVLALEQLKRVTKRKFKMVITSSFRKDHKTDLEKLSKDLIFTGNVDVAELSWLYENASAVLCASEYEGLGLPILEAIRFGKPIACSNIAVFREISNKAFYYFDPLDIEDMTLRLRDAIEKKDWDSKKALFKDINKKYTWERSAGLLAGELRRLGRTQPRRPAGSQKPKVAILSPTPSGYSAVGRIVQEIHDALAGHFEIDYYFENRKKKPVDIRPNYLPQTTNCYQVADFNARLYAMYDAVIYHIGNSEYHFDTIRNALYLPGIAIIHDTKLVECFGEMARQGYIPQERLEAEIKMNDVLGARQSAFLGSLLNNQIGVIFHSDYAEKAMNEINIRDVTLKRSVLALPAPRQEPQPIERRAVHVGLAGVLSGKRKGIEIVKELARNPEIADNAIFHVFGFNLMDPQDIKDLKSYDNITLQTDLSDLAYQTQLANLDIMINYRSEYKGETSSSVLEAMRYGCVVIVNGKAGWFAELPDDAVAKVNEPTELDKILRELILSPGKRARIGKAARIYVSRHHSPEIYGEDLKRLYDRVIEADTVNSKRAAAIRQSGSLSQALKKLGEIHES
jgi:glycosyltransferase involved in cell wall biosynthesis